MIEEAYEVSDAIEQNEMSSLKEELGDLLLQIVFHSRLAEESGNFDFNEVTQGIADKMISRHPHVFGEEEQHSREFHEDEWKHRKSVNVLKKLSFEVMPYRAYSMMWR